MATRRPIATAPKDGSKVRIFWTDADGQENESIGRYQSLDRLKRAGGDWDEADTGWWVFTDSHVQQKSRAHGVDRQGRRGRRAVAWSPRSRRGKHIRLAPRIDSAKP